MGAFAAWAVLGVSFPTGAIVAFVQRRGPGTVCWHTATAAGCDEYLDPVPWPVAGVALVAGRLVAHVRRRYAVRPVSP